MAKKKTAPEDDEYALEPEDQAKPQDPPPMDYMSDDESNLHVATAILTRHIQDWGIPVHQEQLIENAAKAVLDAVDQHIAGGGAEAESPPPNESVEEDQEANPS